MTKKDRDRLVRVFRSEMSRHSDKMTQDAEGLALETVIRCALEQERRDCEAMALHMSEGYILMGKKPTGAALKSLADKIRARHT